MEEETTTKNNFQEKRKKKNEENRCHGCQQVFVSRNAIFRHLRETNGACLRSNTRDYQDFLDYVQNDETKIWVKSVVLYGYTASTSGDDVANRLLQAMSTTNQKINRSYGNQARDSLEIVQQDQGTGALTEVICLKLPPVQDNEEWIRQVNDRLPDDSIRVFGRMPMPFRKFNAEMDVSHRRVEYVLPLDMIYDENKTTLLGEVFASRQAFMDAFPPFGSSSFADTSSLSYNRNDPQQRILDFLLRLKKTMQLFTTRVEKIDPQDATAVMEKQFHNKKRKRQRKKNQLNNKNQRKNEPTITSGGNGGGNVLKRRRFHNFTPRLMAHEYLAYRRLDRFYHRATLSVLGRPFMSLSLTGDLFLHGQVCRVVGLLVAVVRGLVDEDILDCVFDESYPHLVPVPPVPSFAMFAGEASYMNWEGKVKAVLCPRKTNQYSVGFHTPDIMKEIAAFETFHHESIAKKWLQDGVQRDGRLVSEMNWTNQILKPWATRAQEQLKEYRLWKNATREETTIPLLRSVDATVPPVFERVLRCLQEADAGGLWPSTTPKRQLVMVSTVDGENHSSLSVAHVVAKSNKEKRSSAYAFLEGQGGASGSFSVGAMPNEQPKANRLFPELVEAAFELERLLCPHREPSSTIAINRNAQFRPHTDSGAGAGQSTSLIVGLGHYAGGELVVEGEKKDIRYKAVEFNGWKQRHWTMPFRGERFSLVWFTPKGCEGLRGIDLVHDDNK